MVGNILIIDDDENVRLILSRHLAQSGFTTVAARDGIEAQTLLAETDYDVAIIDLSMPKMDGFELLEWMKRHSPSVVPIVFSGTTSVDDAIRAVQEGAFDIISKAEGEYDVFIQHIRRAVDHKRLRDSRDHLLKELQAANVQLKNRLGQLEMAHSVLKSQALALQGDLNRAMLIQQGLLPQVLPFDDRISLAAVYQPAGKVGGDFFDFFPLDDHRLAVYIADTTGHGVSSALLTMFLKHCVRTAREHLDVKEAADPGHVLRAVNQSIIGEMFGRDLFVSMIYLVVDADSGEISYSSAGHPPLLVLRKNGKLQALRVPAPALGINSQVCYTSAQFSLEPDDLVVLYTDGVTETRNIKGDFYGTERFRALLEAPHDGGPALADDVMAALETFKGERAPADDVTLLVLGRCPQTTPYETRTFEPPHQEEVPAMVTDVEVATATQDEHLFICVSGAGSWRESQRVLKLCAEAMDAGVRAIVLDLGACTHLDSTFLGVLHNVARDADENRGVRFEIQNIPHKLLAEMSELGLTQVLAHFRPEPVTLPDSMCPVDGESLNEEEMSRLLLWAHEALVEADSSNADRFAAVLEVLHRRSGRGRGVKDS